MPRRTRGAREPLVWALASTIARSLAPYILLASQIARWICSAPLLLWKASDILLIGKDTSSIFTTTRLSVLNGFQLSKLTCGPSRRSSSSERLGR